MPTFDPTKIMEPIASCVRILLLGSIAGRYDFAEHMQRGISGLPGALRDIYTMPANAAHWQIT